jgi:hypothetical protein
VSEERGWMNDKVFTWQLELSVWERRTWERPGHRPSHMITSKRTEITTNHKQITHICEVDRGGDWQCRKRYIIQKLEKL